MKKLLSLLSVLTITGTSIPTVIAASPYDKQEKILNRSKRENNSKQLIFNITINNNYLSQFYFLPYDSSNVKLLPFSSIINDVIITPTESNLTNKNIAANSAYIATSNGVYYVNHDSYDWTGNKINGINENITKIKYAPSGSVYFITDTGKLYFLPYDSSNVKLLPFSSIINDVIITPTESNLTNKNIAANSAYIATSNGVYYVNHDSYDWTGNKINGINENITKIKYAPSGSVYFITDTGKLYFLPYDSSNVKLLPFSSIINDVIITPTESNLTNKNIAANSAYIATSNGVYYVNHDSYDWTGNKINGINENITKIKYAPSGSVYFITDTGKLYFLPYDSSNVKLLPFSSIINDVIITPTESNLTNKNIAANSAYIATSNGVYYVNHDSYDWTGNKINGINENITKIKYAPSGSVYFITEKIDLFDVITNTELGLLNNNDDQTIINAVETQNNLTNLNYTIRNKTNNSAEFWIDNDNNHYIKWSWKKVYFRIPRRLQPNNIININENLNINYDGNNYIESLNKIINELRAQNVLNIIFENRGREIYEINQNSSEYFRISVSVDDNRNVELVFRTRDLYLEGFIVNNTFFHFSDSSVTSMPNINNSINLGFNSNYSSIVRRNSPISWNGINQAFNDLINYGEDPNHSESTTIRWALARVILATSESIRFRSIYILITGGLIERNWQNISWNSNIPGRTETSIHDIVTNWQTRSNNFINEFNNIQNINNQNINGQIENLLSIIPAPIIEQLNSMQRGIRVILGLIMRPQLNCNRGRNSRNINNIIDPKIKKDYCDITEDSSSGNTIENQITTIKIFDTKTGGKNFPTGDIFIGTTNGLYHWSKKDNKINLKKISDLDYKINEITLYGSYWNNNYAYIKTDNGRTYQVTLNIFGNYSVTEIRDEL